MCPVSISVTNLTKVYRWCEPRLPWRPRTVRRTEVLRGISFSVEAGEIVGLLGLNGSGKSTLIKILSGIVAPTSGEVSVLGYDPFSQRRQYVAHLGVIFGGRTVLWWDVPLVESLRLYADMYGLSRSQFDRRVDCLKNVLGTSVEERTTEGRIQLSTVMGLVDAGSVYGLTEAGCPKDDSPGTQVHGD